MLSSCDRAVTPVMFPPGRERLSTRPASNRIGQATMTIGTCGSPPWPPARRAASHDHVDLQANQLGRELGKPSGSSVGEPDSNSSSLDQAKIAKPLLERVRTSAGGGCRCEDPDLGRPSPPAAPRRRAARRGGRRSRCRGTRGGPSLDHLIRPLQERRRDRQAEGLGGLEVDDELELVGCSNGRSPAWRPLRSCRHRLPRAETAAERLGSIGHQATGLNVFALG